MFQCDMCLKTYGRKDNMLRHKKLAHSDIDSDEDAMSDVSLKEDIFGSIDDNESSHSDDNDDISVTSEDSLVDDPWLDIVNEAFEGYQSQFKTKVKELMEEDTSISDSEAKEKAFGNMESTYLKAIMNSFCRKLLWFDSMRKDPIYKSIKKTVDRLMDGDGYDKEEALKYGILKRRFLFDKILDSYEIQELEGEDAMEEQDDSE